MPCWFAGSVQGEWFGVCWGRAGEGRRGRRGGGALFFLGDLGWSLGVGVRGADIDPHQPVATGNKRPEAVGAGVVQRKLKGVYKNRG